MKFFGIIAPAFSSIIIYVLQFLIGDESMTLSIRGWLPWLLTTPISFTIIFWLNAWRENTRFLQHALMSWSSERLLGFHEQRQELNDEALVVGRFIKKPSTKPEFDVCKHPRDWNFWTINCLFFGVSLTIQVVILVFFLFAL